MKIVLATRNLGKVRELQEFLSELPVEVSSLADFEGVPDVDETGASFSENALLKARAASKATGFAALADDSGLCVDALDGAPGVRSARFAGEGASDSDNNALLLERLRGFPAGKRGARFVCVLALVTPDGEEHLFEGSCPGSILETPRGASGFGYDPLFYDETSGKTFAELTGPGKLARSHRGAALRAFRRWLEAR